MKITLVRHGETDYNRDGKMQGRTNNYLNDEGRRQCKKLRTKLDDKHFDVCYMSPLLRTVETAIILIGDRVMTVTDPRIIERDLGDFENKDYSLFDHKKYWDYKLNINENGVEPIQDVFSRCKDFLNYIIKKPRRSRHI